MAYPAPVLTALGRLKAFFNGGVWVPSSSDARYNPGGFDGDGHAVNFVPALRDVATVGEGIAALASEVDATADRFEAAVAAIEAGPVSSVVGRSGAVTADHIKAAIGYDQLASDIEESVDQTVSNLSGRVTAIEDHSPFTFAYAFR